MFPPRLFLVYIGQIILALLIAKSTVHRVQLQAIKRPWAQSGIWAGILIHTWFYYFTYIAGHNNFLNGATDFATISQSIWNISQGNQPFETILGTHMLRVHFSLVWYPVAVLFKIFPSVDWLVFISALSVSVCAYVIYKIALEMFTSEWMGLAAALSYLLNPYIQLAQLASLHAESFNSLIIFISLYFMIKERWVLFSIAMLVAFLGKEDAGLYYGALGLYLILGKKKFKIGAIIGILGICWSFIAYLYLMPFFGPDTQNLATKYYSYLGSSSSSILKTIITKPWYLILGTLRWEKIFPLFYLLSTTGLTSIFSGWCIIPLAVAAGFKVLTNYPAMFHFWDHYSLHVMPFLYFATLVGIKGICHFFRATNLISSETQPPYLFPAIFLIVLALLVNLENGNNPLSRKFSMRPYKITPHNQLGTRMINMIPSAASVITQENISPHLSFRKKIWVAGWNSCGQDELLPIPEYGIFDLKKITGPQGQVVKEMIDCLHKKHNYELLIEEDGWIILHKNK